MHSIIVIFGATGDLAKHKLFPALEELNKEQEISIIAVGRKPFTTTSFREQLLIKTDFLNKITYVQGDYTKARLYSLLRKTISHTQKVLYYLATPPTAFSDIIKGINSTVLVKHARILIEKPFGTSLATARELHKTISSLISEKQLYLVDHYLGKSMISNIVHLRELPELQPWNNKRIKAVQITAFETKGTEGRGQYYDKTGALKDMIQSHLLQIISLIAMQPPCKTHQECKAYALEKFILKPKTIIRGQYKEYLSEEHVAPDSQTETFIQLTLLNNMPEWKNVPFTITSG
ncbi:MAG: hypothetical protein Q7K43_06635, partial [Candidatus Woesearchaeota archaeon]|nr:hypothetical protein [Candidatus Woesearchaeota archaeon]